MHKSILLLIFVIFRNYYISILYTNLCNCYVLIFVIFRNNIDDFSLSAEEELVLQNFNLDETLAELELTNPNLVNDIHPSQEMQPLKVGPAQNAATDMVSMCRIVTNLLLLFVCFYALIKINIILIFF